MWLIFKFLEEQADKRKAKKAEKLIPDNSTFETYLDDVKVKNRQDLLKKVGEDDLLKIDTFLIDEALGFEVFTSGGESIGTIPSELSVKLERAMEQGLEPYVVNYAVTEVEEVYNCNVTLGLKKN